jgi:hypothetical protein
MSNWFITFASNNQLSSKSGCLQGSEHRRKEGELCQGISFCGYSECSEG